MCNAVIVKNAVRMSIGSMLDWVVCSAATAITTTTTTDSLRSPSS